MAENVPYIYVKTRLLAGGHLCGGVLSFAYRWLCHIAPAYSGRRRRYANSNSHGLAHPNGLTNSDSCAHWQALCNGEQFEHTLAF